MGKAGLKAGLYAKKVASTRNHHPHIAPIRFCDGRTILKMAIDLDQLRVPQVVRENLRAFREGLRVRFGARLVSVRLFGSYARGLAHEESDVDCLVLLDRVDTADDRAVTDLAADLTWQVGGVVISPLIMSEDAFERWKASERQVAVEIEREAIPL
jgi:predicted nucleotidyltransferase